MRIFVMLVLNQLSSGSIDPAFVDLFWFIAGSIGAAFIITVTWKVLRLALYLLSWVVIVLFGLVVFIHLALELL